MATERRDRKRADECAPRTKGSPSKRKRNSKEAERRQEEAFKSGKENPT